MQAKKILSSLGTIVVVVAVVVGMKFYNKNEASAQVLDQATSVVQAVPGFDKDPDYFRSLLDHAHPIAFDESYKMGGRRTSAKFDDQLYFGVLMVTMIERAQQDQRTEIATALQTHSKELGV